MKVAVKIVFLVTCLAAAQKPPANNNKWETVTPLVKQQFGPNFTVTTNEAGAVLVADLDGDGVQDLVVVADSKDPLPDSYDFKYAVADPFNSFFGFGNPAMTAAFGRADPERNHDLLIIFGAGADAWRAATPKAKFVLINVPFDTVEVGRMLIKKDKPPIFVIKAEEMGSDQDSAVYWDIKKKKWKWQPGGGF
jgi:hypothetical protein